MDSNVIAEQLSDAIIATLKECPDISISPKQFKRKQKFKREYKEDDGPLTPLPEDKSSDYEFIDDDEEDQCPSAASSATFGTVKNMIKDGLDRILGKCLSRFPGFPSCN